MTDTNSLSAGAGNNPAAVASPTPPPVGGDAQAQANHNHQPLVEPSKRHSRTPGLWAVDTLIYPVLTHFGVFAVSVWTSYVTNYRGVVEAKAEDNILRKGYNKLANGMFLRGKRYYDPVVKAFGANPDGTAAKNFKMVLFSFLDGCVLAPVIKYFEDRRETFAKNIDTLIGTKPADESVYAEEPKQSWKSILLGRAKTAAIIVPTAIILNNVSAAKVEDGIALQIKTKTNGLTDLNSSFLGKFGEWMERNVTRRLPEKFKQDLQKADPNGVKDFSYTLAFETFYTAVCTFCLYAFSRNIARKDDAKAHVREAYKASHAPHDTQAPVPPAEITPQTHAAIDVETVEPTKPGHARVPAAEEKAVAILADKLRAKDTAQPWQQRVQEPTDPTLAGFAKA